ncbi:hypothetical protein RMATCC62417_01682 [Rhizopus microsporus]|nr:hypothetical protein RMATCC62417_01682 [Rhizopus microsporus]
MNSLTKSVAVFGRATKQVYFTPAASLHVSSLLARESVVDKAKNVADQVNKKTGEKLSDVLEGAEKDKATHLTDDAMHEADKRTPSEKTILETLKGGVEAAKEAVGLGSKKASHAAEEFKDEAATKAKRVMHSVDEASDKASNAAHHAKKTAGSVADDVKAKANETARDARDTTTNVAYEAQNKAANAATGAKEKAKKAADSMGH